MPIKANTQVVNVDDIIQKLLVSKGKDVDIQPHEIRQICLKARDIFLKEPTLLRIKAPIKIIGDVHGQFKDLLRIFASAGSPFNQKYLFLGDYVDRGKNSLESIILLLCFKIKYSDKFFMLRGNHQCSYVNRTYGFFDECKRRANLKVFKTFVDVFNTLPVAAVINKRIFCIHGGLSPQVTKVEQINQIQRPTQVPENGPLCDLLWSDPKQGIKGWEDNLERGVSYWFGMNIVEKFIKQNDLDVVCRAHQVVQQGFEFFGNRKLVTVFSVPNYCNQFSNDGAVMNVDDKLICSFSIIRSKQGNKDNQIKRMNSLIKRQLETTISSGNNNNRTIYNKSQKNDNNLQKCSDSAQNSSGHDTILRRMSKGFKDKLSNLTSIDCQFTK